jgi:hypothetical protein
VCPRCGHHAEDEAAFCSRCGERIGLVEQTKRGPVRYFPPASSRHAPVHRLAATSIVFAVAWIWGVGSLLALVYGFRAKRAVDRSSGRVGGGGLAVMSIVLGGIGLACVPLVVLR